MIELLAAYTIPFCLAFVPLYGLYKKVDILESFPAGSSEAR